MMNLQDKLDAQHVPYSYGWSIVALVATVKLATFPLVKSQVLQTPRFLESCLRAIDEGHCGTEALMSCRLGRISLMSRNCLTIAWLCFRLPDAQVESSMAVQNLKPRLDAIKARYGD